MTAPNTPNRQHHPAYLFITGLCMGAADVVPGVSGGTMAFVMGIYHQLLDAVRAFDLDLLRALGRGDVRAAWQKVPFGFLIPLGLGIATSVLSLAEVLSYLLRQQELLLFSFFTGLVVASIVSLAARHVWTIGGAIACVLGTVVAYELVGLVPIDPGHSPIILFLSGAVAICAMILPGISGSFILLILGQYQYCIDAIGQLIESLKTFDLPLAVQVAGGTILPVAAGAGIGLMLFARVLRWLLSRYGLVTIAALIGFMIGSLRRIWPFKQELEFGVDRHGEPILLRWRNVWPDVGEPVVWQAAGLFLAGFLLVSLIDHIYDRRNPVILLLTGGRWTADVPATGTAKTR